MSVMLRMGGTQVGDDGIPRGGVVPYEDLADSLMGHDGIKEKVTCCTFINIIKSSRDLCAARH